MNFQIRSKLEKTSLSDFTRCGAELLPKLLKQLEDSPARCFQTCRDSLIVCVGIGMSESVKKSISRRVSYGKDAGGEYE